MGIEQWSTTPASNVNANTGINWDEGQAPSTVNNSARDMMAAIREAYEDLEWIKLGENGSATAFSISYVSTTVFKFTGTDRRSLVPTGRRVKAGVGAGVIYGLVSTSSLSASDTQVTVNWDSGNLDASLSFVSVGIINSANTSSPSVTVGTRTNDSAAAGYVGEMISSSVAAGSAVSLTTATPADITSISLTAGDWDVWGTIVTNPNAATTTSFVAAWINTTSVTAPTLPGTGAYSSITLAMAAGVNYVAPVGMTRLSLASTTTVYLSANVGFAINTMGGYGYLAARRRR